MLEIHFVELPRFRQSIGDPRNHLDGWLFYIENSPKEVLDVAIQANPTIARAEKLLQRLGSLDEVRRYYEALEKAARDETSRLAGAWEKGREEGREKGEARGEIKALMKTAGNMLTKGLPDDLIMEMTGLTSDEIAKLKTTN
jgi:predicted transposase/invertase (TIGR01784 family)